MKLPWWFKTVWNEKMGRNMILGILTGGPVFSLASYLADPSPGWWQAWVFAWIFFVALIPIFYWQRNTK